MRQIRQRFICDHCGKISRPQWGYQYLEKTLKEGGWVLYYPVRRPLPAGNTETTHVDLCPQCARKALKESTPNANL
jgi:hypothetical protein